MCLHADCRLQSSAVYYVSLVSAMVCCVFLKSAVICWGGFCKLFYSKTVGSLRPKTQTFIVIGWKFRLLIFFCHCLWTIMSLWVWFSLQNWLLNVCNFCSILKLDAKFIFIYYLKRMTTWIIVVALMSCKDYLTSI